MNTILFHCALFNLQYNLKADIYLINAATFITLVQMALYSKYSYYIEDRGDMLINIIASKYFSHP